jgi:uncharacterized protein
MKCADCQKMDDSPRWRRLGAKLRGGTRLVVGVLADTKAPLDMAQLTSLRRAFKGVDAILHAGGIGHVRVLEQLEEMAPVFAVNGNQDDQIVKHEVLQKVVLNFGPLRLGLTHGYGKPQGLKARVLREFEGAGVGLVVFARNFEACAMQAGEVFFFNPGSFFGTRPEGRKGLDRPRVGLLYLQGKRIEGQPGIAL